MVRVLPSVSLITDDEMIASIISQAQGLRGFESQARDHAAPEHIHRPAVGFELGGVQLRNKSSSVDQRSSQSISVWLSSWVGCS